MELFRASQNDLRSIQAKTATSCASNLTQTCKFQEFVKTQFAGPRFHFFDIFNFSISLDCHILREDNAPNVARGRANFS